MKKLKEYIDKIKPNFMPGGRYSKLQSVFEGFETFLFTPDTVRKTGVHVHDSIDLKRTMIIVVIALIPALLFGMYNVGYQHYLAIGVDSSFVEKFVYGCVAMLPSIVVSYAVGLGIEFIAAQIRGHEIQEGFLVSGILIPMICPINTPVWMIAIATAFAVVFAKEVFGGTGMNIWNVALVARAVLFFGYPSKMSGDAVFVATEPILGMGQGALVDGFTGATPLGQVASTVGNHLSITNIVGEPITLWESFVGLIPGSIGEVSTLCILLGGIILLYTGIASWKVMLSVFLGGYVMGTVCNVFATPLYPASMLTAIEQMCYGGFAFAAVFMATDPVTGARTETGKYIYGFLVGVFAILIRVYNNGYPEGAMLAVLFMNTFAPLIDYCVVQTNIRRRLNRSKVK